MSTDISSKEFNLAEAQKTAIIQLEHKRIVMCADDYGMNLAVNRGILELAAQGRLCATSILVDAPCARDNIDELLASGIQLGLHLNLTEFFGQSGVCLPLKKLIFKAYTLALSNQALQDTIEHQLELFYAITGKEPAYIDGHQHVHQLPQVRNVLLQQLLKLKSKPWLRNTNMRRVKGLPWQVQLKAAIICALGSKGLAARAKALGFRQNPGFLGVYDFKGGVKSYEDYMRNWLEYCQDGDVLMCHPAADVDINADLAKQRYAEYKVISSTLMGHLLARNGLICKNI